MNDEAGALHHYLQSLKILVEHSGYTVSHQLRALILIANLWIKQGRHTEAVELLTLGVHHPGSFSWSRSDAEQKLRQLQAEVPLEIFLAAQERGHQLELKQVVAVLLADLDSPAQVAVPISAKAFPDSLTERERDILRLIADGLNSREIAERLILSVGTIRWYVKQIYSKLDAHSRSEALARARERNLLA